MDVTRLRVIRWVLLPSDDPDEVFMKVLTVALVVIVFMTVAVLSIVEPDFDVSDPNHIGYVVASLLAAATYAALCCGYSVKNVLEIVLSLFLSVVAMSDYSRLAHMEERAWVLVIPMIDVALIVQAREGVINGMVAATVGWFTLVSMDEILGQHVLQLGVEGVPQPCLCDDPPCQRAARTVVRTNVFVAAVFIVDFWITRRFSRNMRSQMNVVREAIGLAEKVASSLSRYEVEEAQAVIDAGDGAALPAELRQSYHMLCSNLKAYRPYLPQSVFALDESERTVRDVDCSSTSTDVPHTPARHGWLAHGAGTGNLEREDSALTSESARTRAPEQLGRDPRKRPVALVCVNHISFLRMVHTAALPVLVEWMRDRFETATEASARRKGVIDLVAGDHFFLSFNAVHHCALHKDKAVDAAHHMTSKSAQAVVPELATTSAVTAGQVTCGDFGTDSLKRFLIIGSAPSWLVMLERVACVIGCSVLADSAVQCETSVGWFSQFRLCASYAKHCPNGTMLFEVTGPRRKTGGNQEWMYELDSMEHDKWAALNAAAKGLFRGDRSALDALARVGKTPADDEVQAAVEQLLGMCSDSGELPVVVLSEAGSSVEQPCAVSEEPAAAGT
eukprot:TRINITY_DN6505_c2_g1_i2.p1 TRINITY_DN6505_c2_g1~~TRINITY_DN6505_c2_g1_i2.p1  ORF type:complete len:644 (+),score=186.99 TRINITY_DN6505_c2_g1_i2:80-1933(+)